MGRLWEGVNATQGGAFVGRCKHDSRRLWEGVNVTQGGAFVGRCKRDSRWGVCGKV